MSIELFFIILLSVLSLLLAVLLFIRNRAEKRAYDNNLLPLVKIRDSGILTSRILENLSTELRLTKYTLVRPGEIKSDEKGELEEFRQQMEANEAVPISDLKGVRGTVSGWLGELEKSGMEYVIKFPVSYRSEGILAFSGPKLSLDARNRLTTIRKNAEELYENAEAFALAEKMSYTDALTELSNQRYMYKRLEEEINRSRRYSRPLAFVIFDIDDLKTINDTYGHQAGDALLKQVGQALKKATRAIDIIARYGGDEFCVVMPEADEETSIKFMQRMLETISGTEIMLEGQSKPLHCSVSMGGALFPMHAKDPQKLIYAADMALLQAKEKGRNRYLIHRPLEAESGV